MSFLNSKSLREIIAESRNLPSQTTLSMQIDFAVSSIKQLFEDNPNDASVKAIQEFFVPSVTATGFQFFKSSGDIVSVIGDRMKKANISLPCPTISDIDNHKIHIMTMLSNDVQSCIKSMRKHYDDIRNLNEKASFLKPLSTNVREWYHVLQFLFDGDLKYDEMRYKLFYYDAKNVLHIIEQDKLSMYLDELAILYDLSIDIDVKWDKKTRSILSFDGRLRHKLTQASAYQYLCNQAEKVDMHVYEYERIADLWDGKERLKGFCKAQLGTNSIYADKWLTGFLCADYVMSKFKTSMLNKVYILNSANSHYGKSTFVSLCVKSVINADSGIVNTVNNSLDKIFNDRTDTLEFYKSGKNIMDDVELGYGSQQTIRMMTQDSYTGAAKYATSSQRIVNRSVGLWITNDVDLPDYLKTDVAIQNRIIPLTGLSASAGDVQSNTKNWYKTLTETYLQQILPEAISLVRNMSLDDILDAYYDVTSSHFIERSPLFNANEDSELSIMANHLLNECEVISSNNKDYAKIVVNDEGDLVCACSTLAKAEYISVSQLRKLYCAVYHSDVKTFRAWIRRYRKYFTMQTSGRASIFNVANERIYKINYDQFAHDGLLQRAEIDEPMTFEEFVKAREEYIEAHKDIIFPPTPDNDNNNNNNDNNDDNDNTYDLDVFKNDCKFSLFENRTRKEALTDFSLSDLFDTTSMYHINDEKRSEIYPAYQAYKNEEDNGELKKIYQSKKDDLKSTIKCFTAMGSLLSGETRKAENIKTNSLLCLDFDGLFDRQLSDEEYANYIDEHIIKKLPGYVIFAQPSCTGMGIFAFVRINDTDFERKIAAIKEDLIAANEETLAESIDLVCKDASRLRFMSDIPLRLNTIDDIHKLKIYTKSIDVKETSIESIVKEKKPVHYSSYVQFSPSEVLNDEVLKAAANNTNVYPLTDGNDHDAYCRLMYNCTEYDNFFGTTIAHDLAQILTANYYMSHNDDFEEQWATFMDYAKPNENGCGWLMKYIIAPLGLKPQRKKAAKEAVNTVETKVELFPTQFVVNEVVSEEPQQKTDAQILASLNDNMF